jgi:hypothetical protein
MRRAIVRFMFFKSPSERFYSPLCLTPLPTAPSPHTAIYNRTQYSMNDWKFTRTSPSSSLLAILKMSII